MIDKLNGNDKKVLNAILGNSRLSANKIAGITGLTAQTVINRLENLEKLGVIIDYQPKVDWKKLGFELHELSVSSVPKGDIKRTELRKIVEKHPEVHSYQITSGTHQFRFLIVSEREGHGKRFLEVSRDLINDLSKHMEIKETKTTEIITYHQGKQRLPGSLRDFSKKDAKST